VQCGSNFQHQEASNADKRSSVLVLRNLKERSPEQFEITKHMNKRNAMDTLRNMLYIHRVSK